MKKIKNMLLLLTGLMLANIVKAQTLDEGRKLLYYEKYISAKAVFQKLVSANPGDAEAAYWLGQTMIRPDEGKDIAGAKEVYRKALEANSNNALLIAGMGHVELLEGKTQDARNRFETAISLSGGKNVAVLNAVGFANGDFDSKFGDAAYAIEKLKIATSIKGMKDPDVYVNFGDAYRKIADGGNATLAYEAALAASPGYARAKYRIGRVYQTQGFNQEDIYMRYYNEAIAMDASYTPVYWTLYQYFYETNVSRSAEYLEKYLTAKGADEPNSCFLRTQITYARGLFQEAITQANACIAAGGANPYPNLYGIIAHASYKLGDSVNAKHNFELYFQKQRPDKLGPLDIEKYAEVLLKFPGNEELAGTFVDQAIARDTTEAGKVAKLKGMALNFEKQKRFLEAADWYKKVGNVKKSLSKVDLYNSGYNYFRAGNYQLAAVEFNTYTQKFPDDIFGYYMMGKSFWGIDSTMAYGLANPSFEKAITVGEAAPDRSKVAAQLIGSYKYMIAYNANIKKDKTAALDFSDRGLLIDSTDRELKGNKEIISKLNLVPSNKTLQVSIGSKGETVIMNDAAVSSIGKDGSINIAGKDGKVISIIGGITTLVESGKVTTIGRDGKITSLTPPPPPKSNAPKPKPAAAKKSPKAPKKK